MTAWSTASMVAAIVGPTASGKTALGIAVAEELGAEIISCDSMVVYRGLDVGTAKPTPAQRARVAHHLLDLVDPGDEFSVQMYQHAARRALASLATRGVPALIVGGSGLYLRAALDPLEFPPTDPQVRAAIAARPPDELRSQLAALDPESARTIETGNVRRIVRALEVVELTGRPYSSFRGGWSHFTPIPVVGLVPPPTAHAAAITARTRTMLADGLLDEARRLRVRGMSATAAAALGYAEASAVLEGGMTETEAGDVIDRRTRELARRQRAWFRADPRVAWLGAPDLRAVVSYLRVRSRPLDIRRSA